MTTTCTVLDQTAALLLRQGLQTLALDLSDATLKSLLHYLDLLIRWNKVYNLTAVCDPVAMVTKHLLDSLAIVPYIPPGRLLDVGSGAGLPALPLALVKPELQVTAVDSNQKKVRFITQAALELCIPNLTAIHYRVEDYRPTTRYNVIISRAFASIPDFITATIQLLAPEGVWLAMKGRYPEAELATLPAGYSVREVIPLLVPGLEAERHLIVLTGFGREELNI